MRPHTVDSRAFAGVFCGGLLREFLSSLVLRDPAEKAIRSRGKPALLIQGAISCYLNNKHNLKFSDKHNPVKYFVNYFIKFF